MPVPILIAAILLTESSIEIRTKDDVGAAANRQGPEVVSKWPRRYGDDIEEPRRAVVGSAAIVEAYEKRGVILGRCVQVLWL
jgi:hypothetical protein